MNTYTYTVNWFDLDATYHMTTTKYHEYVTLTRFKLLEDNGFNFAKIQSLGIAPIILEENNKFLKELRLNQRFKVSSEVIKLSDTGHLWSFEHKFINEKEEVCAIVTTQGAWFSQKERKIVAPTGELFEIVKSFQS